MNNIPSSSQEEQEQTVLTLFEILFQNSDTYRLNIQKLSDFLNEHTLIKILQEIEPELFFISEVDDLTLIKEDVRIFSENNSGTEKRKHSNSSFLMNKFTNFLEIFRCLKKYFQNCPNRELLHKNSDLCELLDINILIKLDTTELLKLGEIILVISALSTKREDYINTLTSLEEIEPSYLNNYITILEKYLVFDREENLNLNSNNNNNMRRSQGFFRDKRTQRMTMRMTIKDRDKYNFCRDIEVLEKEISELKNNEERMTNDLLELELKYLDVARENEILKKNSDFHIKMGEEAFNDSMLITQLKNDLMKKELEIEDIKRTHELILKRQNDEINKLNNTIENIEGKFSEFKSVKFENEKLKLKIKELNLNKEKISEFNNMLISVENKNVQIENLIKEKQILNIEKEKIVKQNLEMQEKCRELEYEKKKIEYELIDLKKETNKNEKFIMSRRNTIKMFSTVKDSGFNLDKLQSDLMEFSNLNNDNLECQLNFDKTKIELEEELNEAEKDLQELNSQLQEQFEANRKLSEEKSELRSQNENLKIQLSSINSELMQNQLEKEKLEISKQKLELDIQKYLLVQDKIENEKVKLMDSVNQLKEKIENLNSQRDNHTKEFESMKLLLKMKTNQIDRILNEKKILMNELNTGNKKSNPNPGTSGVISTRSSTKESTSGSNSNSNKIVAHTSTNNTNTTTPEKSQTKLETENLKLKSQLMSKSEEINLLKDKIKNLEKIEQLLRNQQTKRDNDSEFYKNAYETKKTFTMKENEILSARLCELAMQFVSFKNELLKNVKPSILNQK
jgi:hypothetical protein